MKELEDEIERLMDKWGEQKMLMVMETICYEKAEHLRTNWQDARTAKHWERKGKLIVKFANNKKLL